MPLCKVDSIVRIATDNEDTQEISVPEMPKCKSKIDLKLDLTLKKLIRLRESFNAKQFYRPISLLSTKGKPFKQTR